MGFNGSGVYTLPSGALVSDGTSADASDLNTPLQDLETSLNLVHISDGRKPATGNWPMGGFKQTGMNSGSAATDSTNLGQVQQGTVNWVAAGGTADALTGSYTPAIAALVDGQECFVRATATNTTTTPTYTPNNGVITARTITKAGGQAVAVGDISSTKELHLRYNLANTRWEWLNAVPVLNFASTTEVLTGTETAKAVTPDSLAVFWEKGGDITSAATITIGEGGYANLTGTASISDIDFSVAKDGRPYVLVCASTPTFVHNATTLIVPGAANYTASAGDMIHVYQDSGDNVRLVIFKADGKAVVGGGRELLASASSGASGITLTNISSVYRALAIEFSNLSWDASASQVRVQFSNTNGSAYGAAVATYGNTGAANAAWGSCLIEGIQIPRTSSSNIFIQNLVNVPATATLVTTIVNGVPDSATSGPINAIKITGDGTGTMLIDSGTLQVWGIR
jgi:hypothetical protein